MRYTLICILWCSSICVKIEIYNIKYLNGLTLIIPELSSNYYNNKKYDQ